MSLSPQEIAHVARLARLGLSKEEQQHLGTEINNILGWIDQLQKIDVSQVNLLENLEQPAMHERPDLVTAGNQKEEVLSNAPSKDHGFFAVPKVIE